MARRVLIKFEDGREEIHFHGVFDDHTLCGHDESGDEEWERAITTTKKVNCKDCISIITFCKVISKKEYN